MQSVEEPIYELTPIFVQCAVFFKMIGFFWGANVRRRWADNR